MNFEINEKKKITNDNNNSITFTLIKRGNKQFKQYLSTYSL